LDKNMTETGQNILTFFQGDDKTIVVTLYDGDPDDGNLLPIVGCHFKWVIYNKTTKAIILSKSSDDDITLDTGNSQIRIAMDRADTLNLTPKTYYHECEMVDNNNHASTVFTGEFQLLLSKANYA